MPQPRIAYFDLENSPSLGWFYDPHKEHNIIHVEQDWFMLSFAWQWDGEKKVHCKALCDYPGYEKSKTDDSHLIKDLWKLFDEAEILIAHNGDRFDRRKANSRFLGCGLPPPSPYKTIDTLKIARRQFAQNSNRLGEIGQFLKLGGKLPTTGWDLHHRCIRGDPSAWPIMKKYNKRDVSLLKQVSDRLRKWNALPPDLRIYTGKHSCRSCGSPDIQMRGEERTLTTVKQRYQCKSCNHWGSVPK